MQVPEILMFELEVRLEYLYIHQIIIQTSEQTSHCELYVRVPTHLLNEFKNLRRQKLTQIVTKPTRQSRAGSLLPKLLFTKISTFMGAQSEPTKAINFDLRTSGSIPSRDKTFYFHEHVRARPNANTAGSQGLLFTPFSAQIQNSCIFTYTPTAPVL